ncbi:MAG: proteasome accessory factor PafA2 family protein [Armatimonadota bacterium]
MRRSEAGERLFGIETEYGIWVEGRGAGDLMDESRLLVRAYPRAWAGPWDYRAEDPRCDMRGFQVDHLNYDTQDAQLDRQGSASHLTGEQQRSDRALANGARLYNDHGHPEYATPECRTLRELVAHDRAGERVVLECARLRARETGREVRLYKNNTDFHGMSYGTHEAYLCDRAVPFERLLYGMLPFLVTRLLYVGAGKTGVETAGPLRESCQFQLSQRADFFTEIASVDTLAKRPIFNTRDEAHADSRRYRRLHVICGDANLSEFATALKAGTTSLVLSLVEAGWEPLFRLRNPVDAIKIVSRDPSMRWVLELEDGRTMRATDLQRIYLQDARKLLAGSSADADWTLREWERVLDDLETDVYRLEDRLDWVAKRRLLETYIEAEGLWWESDVIRSLDLEYHNVDPAEGLYYALEEGGQMVRLTEEDDICRALAEGPRTTRGGLRGELVRRYSRDITRISWGQVELRHGGESRRVRLPVEPGAGLPAEAGDLLPAPAAVKTTSDAAPASGAPRGESDVPDQG